MEPAKLLLAATDFSTDARVAAYRAAVLAMEQQAQLELVHVMDGPSLKSLRELFGLPAEVQAGLADAAQGVLKELARDIALDVGLEALPRLREGDVVLEIVAEAEHADIVVLGARGSSTFKDVILGTTVERVVRRCPRPVLVSKGSSREPYKQVLVPVAHGPHSAAALDLALAIAPQADVTLLHAFSVPYETRLQLAGLTEDDVSRYRIEARRQALTLVDTLIENIGDRQRPVRRIVEHGQALQMIREAEENLGIDLIVVGKHGQSMMERILVGNVTRHVLSSARCDVLVVNTPSLEANIHSESGLPHS